MADKIVELDGMRYSVPADASMDEIDSFIKSQQPQQPQESGLKRFARMPSEAIQKGGEAIGLPTVGKVASSLVPDTPAGWGALAGLAGASALTGGLGPVAGLAARAGGSALGAMTGSAAGGETDPAEIGKEGLINAATSAAGEGFGKAIGAGKNFLARQAAGAKGGIQAYLDKYGAELAKIIPGIQGEQFTPSRFFDVVTGGKGDEALGAAYNAGVKNITKLLGKDAVIADPEVTSILNKYFPQKYGGIPDYSSLPMALRPKAEFGLANKPISVGDAINAAQELGARASIASKAPEGGILGREMRQANQQLREAIANAIDQKVPGLGDYYKSLNTAFRRGKTVMEPLQDSSQKIFQQGTTGPNINTAELARAHNDALAALRGIDAEDLATVSRRGALPGGGDVSMKIPGTGLFFGGPGELRGRLSEPRLSVPLYAGQQGTGLNIPPGVSALTAQRIMDMIRRYSNQEE